MSSIRSRLAKIFSGIRFQVLDLLPLPITNKSSTVAAVRVAKFSDPAGYIFILLQLSQKLYFSQKL